VGPLPFSHNVLYKVSMLDKDHRTTAGDWPAVYLPWVLSHSTMPNSDNFSDCGTGHAGNQVGARSESRSRALAPDHLEDARYVPRSGQSLPDSYLTSHVHSSTNGHTRTHGIAFVSNLSSHLFCRISYSSRPSTRVLPNLITGQRAPGTTLHPPMRVNWV
jgi:hypothetical protein